MSISPNVYAVSVLLSASRKLSWREYEAARILYEAAWVIIDELTGEEFSSALFVAKLHNSKLSFWSQTS